MFPVLNERKYSPTKPVTTQNQVIREILFLRKIMLTIGTINIYDAVINAIFPELE